MFKSFHFELSKPIPRPTPVKRSIECTLSGIDKTVFNILKVSEKPLLTFDITRACGLPFHQVSGSLVSMRYRGIIQRDHLGFQSIKKEI